MTHDAAGQVDPTDPTDLELRWRTLMRPHGDVLATDRVGEWAGGAVMVALDGTGTRHLLVHIADQSQAVRLPRPVAGLELTARELRASGQPGGTWIDFASSDPAWNRTFCGLCADVINELPATGAAEPVTMFAVLERWRRFWATDRDGLSRDVQVGLVGELWLLLEWLPHLTVPAVTAWQGPLRGRHDFVTDTVSVEVKTTRTATGPVVHRVARLDQLDEPGTGSLYLLSLRAVPDPLGTESLDRLLTRIRTTAATIGATCAALLDDRLRAVGVSPADAGRYTEPLRIAQQELYRVGSGFPKLIAASFPTGIPAGVVDVAYSLDTSACRPWLVSDVPDVGPLAALL